MMNTSSGHSSTPPTSRTATLNVILYRDGFYRFFGQLEDTTRFIDATVYLQLGVSFKRNLSSRRFSCGRQGACDRDLQCEVGWLWCWLFLPSVKAFVVGIILAYAAGTRSLTAHLAHVKGPSLAFFHMLVKLLPG
jgi:hypothetical protein